MYSCSVFLLCGLVRPHELRTKISGGRSVPCKTDLRKKKRLFSNLRSEERRMYSQAKLNAFVKCLSKLNAETRVLTY